MTKIAILGFGKVGQSILHTIQTNKDFNNKFEIVAIWNRSAEIFEAHDIPPEIKIYKNIESLIANLNQVNLVVECAHPDIVKLFGLTILKQCDLFLSSPTAFSDHIFLSEYYQSISKSNYNCYLAIGATVGIWDVIRLDKVKKIKHLKVSMKKDPFAFKIKEPSILKSIEKAMTETKEVILKSDSVDRINKIAPQNTNTMAIYALAASSLSFKNCIGTIIAHSELETHIVMLDLETKSGLKLNLTRDNPANAGAVTGSATFSSFLSSLYHYREGIYHNHFTFC